MCVNNKIKTSSVNPFGLADYMIIGREFRYLNSFWKPTMESLDRLLTARVKTFLTETICLNQFCFWTKEKR